MRMGMSGMMQFDIHDVKGKLSNLSCHLLSVVLSPRSIHEIQAQLGLLKSTMAESISLEETNKIRISLGLKPLTDDSAPTDTKEQTAEDNFAKRQQQEAQERERRFVSLITSSRYSQLGPITDVYKLALQSGYSYTSTFLLLPGMH
jgi:HIND motif